MPIVGVMGFRDSSRYLHRIYSRRAVSHDGFAIWIENLPLFTYIRGQYACTPRSSRCTLSDSGVFRGMVLITDLRLNGWLFRGETVASIVNGTRWPKRLGLLWMGTWFFTGDVQG